MGECTLSVTHHNVQTGSFASWLSQNDDTRSVSLKCSTNQFEMSSKHGKAEGVNNSDDTLVKAAAH